MNTNQCTAPLRHRARRAVLQVALLGAGCAWVRYKSVHTRGDHDGISVAVTRPATVPVIAHAERVEAGSSPVAGESWVIGTGVAGYLWRPAEPRGVVLFQHGWGDYAQRWVQGAHQMIPRLVAAGYAVYAFDMWGSGNSPGMHGLTDANQAVQDHLAARRAISQGSDSELPLFLVGHSLGALVTVSSALQDQLDLNGVILLAPAIKYDAPSPLLAVARVGALVAPTAPVPGMRNEDMTRLLTRDATIAREMEADELLFTGAMNFLTASTGGSLARANWGRYEKLTVPVLAIHGTADESTDPRGSAQLIDKVASPDKTLNLVQGAKHSLLDDLDAESVMETMLSWIKARSA